MGQRHHDAEGDFSPEDASVDRKRHQDSCAPGVPAHHAPPPCCHREASVRLWGVNGEGPRPRPATRYSWVSAPSSRGPSARLLTRHSHVSWPRTSLASARRSQYGRRGTSGSSHQRELPSIHAVGEGEAGTPGGAATATAGLLLTRRAPRTEPAQRRRRGGAENSAARGAGDGPAQPCGQGTERRHWGQGAAPGATARRLRGGLSPPRGGDHTVTGMEAAGALAPGR